MTVIYLILGLLVVGLAFDFNKTVGGWLLIVLVLGFWLSAKQKGILDAK
jgi:hypothetical protein